MHHSQVAVRFLTSFGETTGVEAAFGLTLQNRGGLIDEARKLQLGHIFTNHIFN
jgi:hypothetical protein